MASIDVFLRQCTCVCVCVCVCVHVHEYVFVTASFMHIVFHTYRLHRAYYTMYHSGLSRKTFTSKKQLDIYAAVSLMYPRVKQGLYLRQPMHYPNSKSLAKVYRDCVYLLSDENALD